jgi:RNA polymerase sigma-70 factor (ECF subfamily)
VGEAHEVTTASLQLCPPSREALRRDLAVALAEADDYIEMTSAPVLAGFSELYKRHYEAVFRAALRVTGNPADAEDVLQTVFLRVLSRSEGLSRSKDDAAADRPSAYFRRAAVNAAVDLLRRRTVHAETAYDDQAPHAAVEQPPLLKEVLRRAIATLDSDDATLFLLRHVEGLSNEELAGVFQIEKNNVAVRLHRIRLRLQSEMQR